MSHRTTALLLILLCGLVLRAGYSLSRSTDEQSLESLPDQREYLQCAREWQAGNGWRYFDPRFQQWIYAARTPGYPFLISLCGGSIRTVRLAQAAVDVSTALAMYLLARRLGLGGWSLLAAAGVALNPLLVYFSSLLLTETLYTAMLAWAMLLLVQRWWLSAGVLLSLGVLVRSSGAPLALVLPPVSAWLLGASRRPVLLSAVAAAATLLLVLLPWAQRNQQVLGQRVWLASNGGITLYDGVHPHATGPSDQRFVQSMPTVAQMGELERDRFFTRAAWAEIRTTPLRLLRLALAKAGRMWSPLPLSENFARPLYVVVGLAWSVPLYALALLGMLALWKQHLPPAPLPAGVSHPLALLILPMLLFTLMHAVSVGSLRYRMPLEPLLALLAAAGVAGVMRRRNESVC